MIGFFDEYGLCRAIHAHNAVAPDSLIEAEVEPGWLPDRIWLDSKGKVRHSKDADKNPLPFSAEINSTIKFKVPANCVLILDSERFTPGQHEWNVGTEPRAVMVELRGAQIGSWQLYVQSYAEQRRAEYPPIEVQLDMLYHKGFDSWKETIAAIKAKYPKAE